MMERIKMPFQDRESFVSLKTMVARLSKALARFFFSFGDKFTFISNNCVIINIYYISIYHTSE